MNENTVLVSGAVLFKETGRRTLWFIVKQTEENGWEIAKTLVRKGESSVRASLRSMGEKGGMTTKVLEEVGRAGGITTLNGKTVPQRHIFYLMILKSEGGESIGFQKSIWLEYAQAVRKLTSKRERQMLKEARKIYRAWKKEMANKKDQ